MKFSQEKFSERFEREAKAIGALNHPNICTLHDAGPNYLSMEYVEGAPLKGPLPLDRALKYAVQICAALDHAHKKGITHRDPKPANILVTKTGIKLLDFGLTKLASANSGLAPNAGLSPDDALSPGHSSARTRSWARCTTCHRSSYRRRPTAGRLTAVATSSRLAWCCTNCSPVNGRSAVKTRPRLWRRSSTGRGS
jgi:serine/threonine protein kinase